MLIRDYRDNIKMAVEEAGNAASFFTYPIFQANKNNRPELVASSVAVEADSKYFLCTAKHTITALDRSRPTYSTSSNIANKGKFVELKGNGVFSQDADDIEFDLCLIDVSEIRENFTFVNESEIAVGNGFSEKSFNVLVGYPLSKNKPTKSIKPDLNEVSTGFEAIGVKLDPDIQFDSFKGIRENAHLGFRYNLDHKKQMLTYPRGMSGCGVWNVSSVYNTKNITLAGIFIEYYKREKVGFATHANYIRKLRKFFV